MHKIGIVCQRTKLDGVSALLVPIHNESTLQYYVYSLFLFICLDNSLISVDLLFISEWLDAHETNTY